jgi:hypothetical protein
MLMMRATISRRPLSDLVRRHCLLYRPSHAQGAELLLLGAVFRRR